jgi:hypothetical protein
MESLSLRLTEPVDEDPIAFLDAVLLARQSDDCVAHFT